MEVMGMYGHASPSEMELIKRFEQRVASGEGPLAKLDLGVLYIEPAHEEAAAVHLFESVLSDDPQNGPARLWLAYCCIHYLMEREALRRAVGLLDGLDDDPSVRGAAAMLRAEALEDLGELTKLDKVHLLETSVTLSPGWVRNRQRLAWAYEAAHRFNDAHREVRRAISNLEAGVRLGESVERRVFEELITGRAEPHRQEDLEQHAHALERRIRGDD